MTTQSLATVGTMVEVIFCGEKHASGMVVYVEGPFVGVKEEGCSAVYQWAIKDLQPMGTVAPMWQDY